MDMTDVVVKENGITEEQLIEYKDAFDCIDKNGDGVITLEEIDTTMKAIHFIPTEAELKDIVYVDGFKTSDHVEYWEYLDFISAEYAHSDELRDLSNAFKVMDRSGKGAIGPADVVHLMKRLDENITLEEAKEMIKEADKDGDGKISRQEFTALFIKTDDEQDTDEESTTLSDTDEKSDRS